MEALDLGYLDLGYSEEELVQDLRKWWAEQARDGEDDPFADGKVPTGTIFDVQPDIDSLGAVTGLLTIEKRVGFEVPTSVIRCGGYRNFDDMVSDLLPKIRALATKNRKKEVAE